MMRLSAFPGTREQAHRVLTLLGVPTPARLVAQVHGGLFDGDLSTGALTAMLHQDERDLAATRTAAAGDAATPVAPIPAAPTPAAPTPVAPMPAADDAEAAAGVEAGYRLCRGLDARHLTATGDLVALASWPLTARVGTPTSARADALAAVVRVAEFVAVRAAASRTAGTLLRHLAADVPGGLDGLDPMRPRTLADAARAALADPRLVAALDAERPLMADAATRAARLDEQHRLFGLPRMPRQPRRSGFRP